MADSGMWDWVDKKVLIGGGVGLVVVGGLAWWLTSQRRPSLAGLLGLGADSGLDPVPSGRCLGCGKHVPSGRANLRGMRHTMWIRVGRGWGHFRPEVSDDGGRRMVHEGSVCSTRCLKAIGKDEGQALPRSRKDGRKRTGYFNGIGGYVNFSRSSKNKNYLPPDEVKKKSRGLSGCGCSRRRGRR